MDCGAFGAGGAWVTVTIGAGFLLGACPAVILPVVPSAASKANDTMSLRGKCNVVSIVENSLAQEGGQIPE